ncbi:hypothetical protein Vadar_025872 [Vaccinium darrowii]|uniref:Uncharacterized protein n=1 Tax=Vaccinium darrowii TaxID=229202 RepID=A0ACB7Y1R8_9ERIC|nr:hypothetical protein Vadar_025872 [Vaccinium darrowii]
MATSPLRERKKKMHVQRNVLGNSKEMTSDELNSTAYPASNVYQHMTYKLDHFNGRRDLYVLELAILKCDIKALNPRLRRAFVLDAEFELGSSIPSSKLSKDRIELQVALS